MSTEYSMLENYLEHHASKLRGHVLRRFEKDEIGRGYFSEKTEELFLYADGTFRYDVRTSSATFRSGGYMPWVSNSSSEGTWELKTSGHSLRLNLLEGPTLVRNWEIFPYTSSKGKLWHLRGEDWVLYPIRS